MKNTTIFTLAWLRAALIRAVKTMAQTALGMITIGMGTAEVDWRYVASVAIVAGIYSLLTSVAGLPEVPTETPQETPPVTPSPAASPEIKPAVKANTQTAGSQDRPQDEPEQKTE